MDAVNFCTAVAAICGRVKLSQLLAFCHPSRKRLMPCSFSGFFLYVYPRASYQILNSRSEIKRQGRRETMSGSGRVVCVTGASGYIASWLVKLLLQRGYTVRATTELIEPAVKGTLNVFSSCVKTPSVRRVVVTSTMGSVYYNGRPRTPDIIVDETWFSNAEFCKQEKMWYQLSKTLAEEVAWKFSKDNSIDMVTIHPAFVIGPLLQPTLNTSAAEFLKLINGSSTYPNVTYGWVNVKDVAMAHILAFEVPSASGRYCLVESVAHCSEIVKILHEQYSALKLPENRCADDKPLMPIYHVSKEKAKSLGIDYIPLETSIKEIVKSLKEKGFVSF
ncbi:phenylacetaldehyde reductase isoform X3 [Elaeis guineensis]|uniref:Cinnamoyl-CoA reductase 1 isoform X3 n=1 Tax=Elaeis guineensis var. tenera TaxID=51953 RepID=A0A6I9QAW6_ELAGV|nr:cinnamoyl-CoA reductase 1 isoform X3 [Elaeis guineensis]